MTEIAFGFSAMVFFTIREPEFYLHGKRYETDKEMNQRIDKAEKARIAYERAKAKREAKEKVTLEKLKEKYEVAS